LFLERPQKAVGPCESEKKLLRGFFLGGMSWEHKKRALGSATPKARLHKDFREEVVTGGSVT